jgi:hypothetical protein
MAEYRLSIKASRERLLNAEREKAEHEARAELARMEKDGLPWDETAADASETDRARALERDIGVLALIKASPEWHKGGRFNGENR